MNGYRLNFKNRSYELPKYSIRIRRSMDAIDTDNASISGDREQKYRNMYEFIKELVGTDKAKEIFEGDDFEDIDLNDVTIAYLGVCSAYDKPVADLRKQSLSDMISKEDRELLQSTLRNAADVHKLCEALTEGKAQGAGALR